MLLRLSEITAIALTGAFLLTLAAGPAWATGWHPVMGASACVQSADYAAA